jgi:glycine hydroxymethyltransferase
MTINRTPASPAARRFTDELATVDPEIAAAIAGEHARQREQIELIASENLVSRAVLQAQGSILTNKTVEGYPGARYYGGAEFADRIEQLAIDRACRLFGCRYANVQPHSGSNANQAVYHALLEGNATLLSMSVAAGGHISHGHPATQTGRRYRIVSYGVRYDDERLDYEQLHTLALQHRPQLIIAGGSAYPRQIDFERCKTIANEIDALLLVDMAHFAGLVASGLYPNPFPHADVVTTTTYKSLRGARGGIILCNDAKLAKRVAAGVFPGVQGSVLLHGVAGKAVCLREALTQEFRDYNAQVLSNADCFCNALTEGGLRIVSDGTDTGMLLVDLRALQLTGSEAVHALEQAGLTCNKNLIPFDPQPAEIASGLRLSTNAGTARGFGTVEFSAIGTWLIEVLHALALSPAARQAKVSQVRAQVRELCEAYPFY